MNTTITTTTTHASDLTTNKYGQTLGEPMGHWTPPSSPTEIPTTGRFCRLERLNPKLHGQALYQANAEDITPESWTYLPYGPFRDFSEYQDWLSEQIQQPDQKFYAIIDLKSGKAVGLAAYLRIMPSAGSVEVGHLKFSPRMQRTPLSTEAMYLMMQHAFALGYRRYEWKCNDFNEPSKRAALRLGFQFEGVFRQAQVVKGHNRDTAWFSVIDKEWPQLEMAFQQWLSPQNFDDEGEQVERLVDIRQSLEP
ncbi:GNAT family N-acetyltransferase [Litoribrevibacter euphylliae]|uniref:GNAT family N-acetyltransferase n=1 Tax=Litoribrevibacter euphylliae TaxID=1834034 RepID=A0ABV7HJZ6_9GAMM